jgi:cytochrome bd-type quinol oxidase subunit 1
MGGRLYDTGWFLWAAFLSFPSGFVAVLAGWFTAEWPPALGRLRLLRTRMR